MPSGTNAAAKMRKGEIIIVSPDPSEASALEEGLREDGVGVAWAASLEEGLVAARSDSAQLAIVDSRIPRPIDAAIQIRRFNSALGYLLLVGQEEDSLAFEAARRGAYDYILRPVNVRRARLRVLVALEKHSRVLEDRAYTVMLEDRVMQRTEEMLQNRERIRAQFVNTIRALENALQAKNEYTEGHSRRVAETSVEIARAMGVPREEIRHVELAALFHDIGKIGIRDEILNKTCGLTESEYEHIKIHPVVAEQILSPIEELVPIVKIVKHEHERWDGKGYPDGLCGPQIPLGSRIIAVADAWDSMVFDRVYRRALTLEEALDEILKNGGIMFDPDCVQAFCDLERRRLQDAAAAG
jgi:response regulator RpfG family c-di-GMP phosphodiesterase